MANLWPVKIVDGGSQLRGRATGGTVTTLVDTSKNLSTDIVKDKLIKIVIDGVEYVRKITSNTADTITIPAIVTGVAAGIIFQPAGKGKITINASETGSYANEYWCYTEKGEGGNAETTAVFEDGALTITLGTDAGTAASAKIGAGVNKEITITANEVGVLEGYSIEVAAGTGESQPLTAGINPDTGLITVTLGTDATGALDPTKNKASDIAAILNNTVAINLLFTAAADGDGSGVFSEAVTVTDIEGGIDPVINATAAEVKAAIDLLEGTPFTATVNTAGVIDTISGQKLDGGVDEVKVREKTEYFVTL